MLSKQLPLLAPIFDAFEEAGHVLYITGGAARDLALYAGTQEPADWDLVTDAPEFDIPGLLRAGEAEPFAHDRKSGHPGVVYAKLDDIRLDVAPFKGGEMFTDSLYRDFTANALYMDRDGKRVGVNTVIAYDDLQKRRLDLCSSPQVVFKDPTRVLRAYRFASQYGLTPTDRTRAALRQYAPIVKQIPGDMVAAELKKIAAGPGREVAFRMMMEDGVMHQVFWELSRQVGYDQENKHHHLPLWEHTLEVVRNVPTNDPLVVIAALLHDVGKPSSWQQKYLCQADGCGWYFKGETGQETFWMACPTCGSEALLFQKSYHGHDGWGSNYALEVLPIRGFSNGDTETIAKLINLHTAYLSANLDDRMLRRIVHKLGGDHMRLFALMIGDRTAHHPDYSDATTFMEAADKLAQGDWTPVVKLKPLVDGNRVMALTGLYPGPEIKVIHNALIEKQLDGEITTVDEAEAFVLTLAPPLEARP